MFSGRCCPPALRAAEPRCATLPAVSLLTELDAFPLDRRRCGELDSEVDEATVWLACDCGAGMARRVDEYSAPAAWRLEVPRR